MSNLAKTFGRNMKAAREKAKLDGKTFAARAGIVQSYVSMLEAGERSPSLETVERVAKVFKIDPLKLLGGK